MAYEARIYRILIASPSDVSEERELVTQCIQEWNDLNSAERKIVLLPLRWETHGRPEYGRKPQEIINTTIVDHCDLLIGIFWTRIGTDTGASRSGTVEEIERVAKAGRPVMLYFSRAKLEPDRIEIDQFTKLNEFKKLTLPNALVEHYSNAVEFKDKLSRHLEIKVREFMSESAAGRNGEPVETPSIVADLDIELIYPKPQKPDGTNGTFRGYFFDMPKLSEIPDSGREGDDSTGSKDFLRYLSPINKDYYREAVVEVFQKALMKPVQFALRNIGVIGIRDIHIDLEIQCNEAEIYFVEPSNLVNSSRVIGSHWPTIQTASRPDLESVLSRSKSWRTSIEVAAIQPKRAIESNIVGYLGVTQDAKIGIKATIYGDCFPEPRVKELQIQFQASKLDFTVTDLLARLKTVGKEEKAEAEV